MHDASETINILEYQQQRSDGVSSYSKYSLPVQSDLCWNK